MTLPAELLALTLKVKRPLFVGVPDSTPAFVRLIPLGSVPDALVKVGAGVPDALNV